MGWMKARHHLTLWSLCIADIAFLFLGASLSQVRSVVGRRSCGLSARPPLACIPTFLCLSAGKSTALLPYHQRPLPPTCSYTHVRTYSFPPLPLMQDWLDIDFGVRMGVDFIAVSFVKTADVLTNLKSYLASRSSKHIEVIAKVGGVADSVSHLLVKAGGCTRQAVFWQNCAC